MNSGNIILSLMSGLPYKCENILIIHKNFCITYTRELFLNDLQLNNVMFTTTSSCSAWRMFVVWDFLSFKMPQDKYT